MKYYNYLVNETNDVINYINEELDIDIVTKQNPDKIRNELYDRLFNEDSVTGNASGSSTMNSTTAE